MKNIILVVSFTLSTIFVSAQTLKWVKQIGESGFDSGESVNTDADGNVYVTGKMSSLFFISKFDANGNKVFTKNIPTVLNKSANVDSSGNIYITGTFKGKVDFDPEVGVAELTSQASSSYPYTASDVYVAKYDNLGNFIWAKSFGQEYDDIVNAILVDVLGDVYVTGDFVGTVDFDPSSAVNSLTASGYNNHDAYILKLSGAGNYVWAKRMGSDANYDAGNSLSTDAFNNIYIAGQFAQGGIFYYGSGTATLPILQASKTSFIVKLNSAGDFVWVKNLGGSVKTIMVDAFENVYYGADFSGSTGINTDTTALTLESKGFDDFYISKLSNTGAFVWAKHIGGSVNHDNIQALAINNNNLYATGRYAGVVKFDTNDSTHTLSTYSSIHSSFIVNYDTYGNYIWAVPLGNGSNVGPNEDIGYSVAADNAGNVYVTGTFRYGGSFLGTSLRVQGGTDGYVVKINGLLAGVNSGFSSNTTFRIYPNPATTNITIDLGTTTADTVLVSIVNILGEEVISTVETSHVFTIKANSLKSGLYFVTIKSQGKQLTQKLVIN